MNKVEDRSRSKNEILVEGGYLAGLTSEFRDELATGKWILQWPLDPHPKQRSEYLNCLVRSVPEERKNSCLEEEADAELDWLLL